MEQRTEKIEKADALDFAPGERFGSRYQIIEVIGQGGMGKVFKALDLELNESVALKMILPHLSSNPDVIARFKRELQLAREINHDHVIRIHDLGEISGIKFISMKYIDGQTLRDILKASGKLSFEKIIHIATQLCEALAAAHKKGVVHRDLKPQNIMLDKKGMVYVLDFGIARSAERTDITQSNIILGTPDFMSPEQIQGVKADARTDIYALGIILYEMATGELPFSGDTPAALLAKHLNEKPAPPKKLNKQIPPFLQEVILQCIEKKPEDRFQSVDEILIRLNAGKSGSATAPLKQRFFLRRKTGKANRKHILRYSLLALLMLFLGISIVSFVTDLIYKSKLDEFEIEYKVFHENYFPVTKGFLPPEWQSRDCNAWDTYSEIFSHTNQNYMEMRHIGNMLDRLWKTYSNKTSAEFSRLSPEWDRRFRVLEISNAVKCDRLAPENGAQMDLLSIYLATYTKYVLFKSRIELGKGQTGNGIDNLITLGYLLNDIIHSSPGIYNYDAAIDNFKQLCVDLIPVLLAQDITLDATAVDSIERMITTTMEHMSPEILCQQNYFSDIVEIRDMIQYKKNNSDAGYFFLYKFFFYRSLFSANKWLYELMEYNQKIKKEFEFITEPQKRMEYAYKLQKENPTTFFDMMPLHPLFSNLFAARSLGKLVLILIKMKRYGKDSLEFSNLKSTDFFINEVTGKPFEFEYEANGNLKTLFSKTIKIDLYKINYGLDLKKIMDKLRTVLIKQYLTTSEYLEKKYPNI